VSERALWALERLDDLHIDGEGSYHIQGYPSENCRVGFTLTAHWYIIEKGEHGPELEHGEVSDTEIIDKLMQLVRERRIP